MQDDFDNDLDMPDDDMAGDSAATEDLGDELGAAGDIDAEAEGGGSEAEPSGRPSGGARAKPAGGSRKSAGRKPAAKAKKAKPAKKVKPAKKAKAAKKPAR